MNLFKKKDTAPSQKSVPQDVVRAYDELVGITMMNIYSIASRQDEQIVLYNFNRHNKECLYFLRVALLARDLYGMEVYVECSWRDWLALNWKARRGFARIKKNKGYAGMDIFKVLDFMYSTARERCGSMFNFGMIYDTFYEGSLG